MKVHIFHNILWSKYKGGVFSEVHRLAQSLPYQITFTQIAETEASRIGLSSVDMAYHRYPHALLFRGSYQEIPRATLVKSLYKRLKSEPSDIVVIPGYERIEYWVLLLLCILHRTPRAVFCDSTIYDNRQTLLKGLAKRIFFSLCDGFFGYGKRSKEYLMHYGVPEKKIRFRCQAAALPLGYTKETALHARLATTNTRHANPTILYVGRLSPEKNLETLIAAMPAVLRATPNIKLRIVGNGPSKQALQALIDQLGLNQSTELVGALELEKLPAEYLSAAAMVLPSTSEPWGLVVNEALSYGCPVVVSHRCGCVPELVIDGFTGYQFNATSAAGLAEAVEKCLTLDQKPETAANCINHIDGFSPTHAATQILEGCKSIFQAKKNP